MDDEEQFWSDVSALEPRFAEEAADITNPSQRGTFEIEERLISRFSASRLKQRLEEEEIGSRTPSQFLWYVLAGDAVPESLVSTLWGPPITLRPTNLVSCA